MIPYNKLPNVVGKPIAAVRGGGIDGPSNCRSSSSSGTQSPSVTMATVRASPSVTPSTLRPAERPYHCRALALWHSGDSGLSTWSVGGAGVDCGTMYLQLRLHCVLRAAVGTGGWRARSLRAAPSGAEVRERFCLGAATGQPRYQ